jgi:hypothetical protein
VIDVGVVIVAVVIGLAIVAGLWFILRGGRQPAPAAEPERPRPVISDNTPMTGLELALDQATDRSGRNMREKMEDGTGIDDLRVPDDTGPILRRALDSVEQAPPRPAADVVEAPVVESGEG